MTIRYLGSALLVAGALCWAFFATLIKPYTERLSGIDVGAYSQAGGALFVAAVGMPSILATDWASVPGPVWAAIVYSGIGSARRRESDLVLRRLQTSGRRACRCSAICNRSSRSPLRGSCSAKYRRYGKAWAPAAS